MLTVFWQLKKVVLFGMAGVLADLGVCQAGVYHACTVIGSTLEDSWTPTSTSIIRRPADSVMEMRPFLCSCLVSL